MGHFTLKEGNYITCDNRMNWKMECVVVHTWNLSLQQAEAEELRIQASLSW
jgi:hypothetical protein